MKYGFYPLVEMIWGFTQTSTQYTIYMRHMAVSMSFWYFIRKIIVQTNLLIKVSLKSSTYSRFHATYFNQLYSKNARLLFHSLCHTPCCYFVKLLQLNYMFDITSSENFHTYQIFYTLRCIGPSDTCLKHNWCIRNSYRLWFTAAHRIP